MKKLLILPALALMLGVAFSSCKKDEEKTPSSSMLGTYAGDIYAEIPEVVSDAFEEDFKVEQKDGKTILSLTLTVTIAQANNMQVPLPIKVELTDITPVNGTHEGMVFNGNLFKVADYTYNIPVPAAVGTGTLVLQGAKEIEFGNYTGYDGSQGDWVDDGESVTGGFTLYLLGTATGTIFGTEELPVIITLEGVKK